MKLNYSLWSLLKLILIIEDKTETISSKQNYRGFSQRSNVIIVPLCTKDSGTVYRQGYPISGLLYPEFWEWALKWLSVNTYFLAASDSQISYSDPAMESDMLAQRKQLYGKLLKAYLVQSILNIVAHSCNECFQEV
jgi:hypothetical protein